MIRINPEHHLSTLITFDLNNTEKIVLRGYLDTIYHEFLDYWNEDHTTRDSYNRINYLTKNLNSNVGVETIFNELESLVTKTYRKFFWDPRLRLKLKVDPSVKYRMDSTYYVFLLDLDFTVDILSEKPEDPPHLSELIDDNPDAELLNRIQDI